MIDDTKASLRSRVEEDWLKKLPWVASAVAGTLIVAYFWVFRSEPFGEKPSAFGEFGDYVGGLLNPLISLFTLIVAVSVWKLQKSELLETRNAIKEQGRTADLQRREQRFFDFLNIYRSTQDSIKVYASSISTPLTGKRAFSLLNSHDARNPFRKIAEKELMPATFGRKWMAKADPVAMT